MTDFAAIDFETANGRRSSVCSVGIVIVRGGKIVDKFYSLIKPSPNYYTYWTTEVHGLTRRDTDGQRIFPDVWAQVEDKIKGLPLVAHNRPFDESCLKAVFEEYGMEYPGYEFHCTLAASRRCLDIPSHQLHLSAAACGYDMENHHHALCDAEACAAIALKIAMETTIIAVGNGGYNLASDIIKTNTFPDSKFIVCDTNGKDLEQNKINADESFLLEKFRGHVKASLSGLVDNVVDASTDTIILCATFGGMTGSKFAPLIALNAILKGKFVCSLIALNFIFEGNNHNKLASNARMQTIAASNLVIQQNNDRLKEISYLGLGDMNKPIVDTAASVLRNNTLNELSLWVGPDSIQNLIPKEYQIADMPLIWLRSDSYRGISQEERMNVFNLYA